jgi:hypothetical protein
VLNRHFSQVIGDVRMKQKIEDILDETGYKESRAAKMDLNDILKFVCFPISFRVFDYGLQTAISLP